MLLMSLVYENFELYNPTISLEMIVWSLCVGLAIGAAASYINRRVVGDFVRRLLREEIHSPEKAVSLEKIGCAKNIFVRHALREGTALRRIVLCANEEEMVLKKPSSQKSAVFFRKLFSLEDEPKRILDLNRARFYIPEESRIGAELRYDAKGTTLPNLILSLILLAGIGFAALYVLPELFTLMDNFLTLIGG